MTDVRKTDRGLPDTKPLLPNEEHQRFYLLFRQQIVAEDNLTNHRMTWLFALQAILLALLAGVLKQGPPGHVRDFGTLKWVICFLGSLGSVMMGLGIRGAQNAIRNLKEQYIATYSGCKIPDHMPPIVGDDLSHFLGNVPLFMPILCFFVWVAIALMLL